MTPERTADGEETTTFTAAASFFVSDLTLGMTTPWLTIAQVPQNVKLLARWPTLRPEAEQAEHSESSRRFIAWRKCGNMFLSGAGP
jgi:hypothetical protein